MVIPSLVSIQLLVIPSLGAIIELVEQALFPQLVVSYLNSLLVKDLSEFLLYFKVLIFLEGVIHEIIYSLLMWLRVPLSMVKVSLKLCLEPPRYHLKEVLL